MDARVSGEGYLSRDQITKGSVHSWMFYSSMQTHDSGAQMTKTLIKRISAPSPVQYSITSTSTGIHTTFYKSSEGA